MYGLLHYLTLTYPNVRGGFIHIPYLPEQAVKHPGTPSMALETITTALKIAIKQALENSEDMVTSGGTTH